jgi:hypothetical protein
VITNCHRNIMGTVSFDGKFAGMRKAQDFIVYPMQDAGERINIQSEHRWGNIDLATGRGLLSAHRAQYANAVWFTLCYARCEVVKIELAPEDLQTLRQWVKSTGGLEVGSSIVLSDNTGAMAL